MNQHYGHRRIHNLMWRWSLLVFLAISSYWAFFYYKNGYIPSFGIPNPNFPWFGNFLFGISRLWDLVLGVFVALNIWVSHKTWRNDGITSHLGISISWGSLIMGLLFGAPVGLFLYLAGWILIGLVYLTIPPIQHFLIWFKNFLLGY